VELTASTGMRTLPQSPRRPVLPRATSMGYADVFAYAPQKPVHLVVSSLFTHHLAEADVIRFLQWMERHTELDVINDLSRGAISYYSFRIFSKLAGLHNFVRHDGLFLLRAPLCGKIGEGCARCGSGRSGGGYQGIQTGTAMCRTE